MRLLVCGGRDYSDRQRVIAELLRLNPEVVITGGARGADSIAAEVALDSGTPTIIMPAPWNRHGRGAGAVRNAWMLKYASPDRVLAFPGGNGTADMVRRARAAGIAVTEVA